MAFKFARLLIRIVMRLITHIEVIGQENTPPQGAFIVVSNHLGRLDAPLIYLGLDRSDVVMMVAEKYKKNPIWRWFVRHLDAMWVDRFNADFAAMREALKRLKAGHVLVLAPEGTRSPCGALIEGRPGSSYLAAKAGVPLVPVAITGTEDALVKAQYKRLRRPHITVRVGKPFTLPPLPTQQREAALQQYTDEIMCQIAALLPERYRGVYADHPRLKAILAEQETLQD